GLELIPPTDTTNAAGEATGGILVWTPNDRGFRATIDGITTEMVAVLQVGRAPVSAGRSNMTVSSATTAAGMPVTVTVTVRDLGGNPFPDATVVLSTTGGTPVFEQPGPTDGNGVSTGTVASNGVG